MTTFNRWENQCKKCSCYCDNWDWEIASKEPDHECTLEHDTFVNKECEDFDNINKGE